MGFDIHDNNRKLLPFGLLILKTKRHCLYPPTRNIVSEGCVKICVWTGTNYLVLMSHHHQEIRFRRDEFCFISCFFLPLFHYKHTTQNTGKKDLLMRYHEELIMDVTKMQGKNSKIRSKKGKEKGTSSSIRMLLHLKVNLM